MRVEKSITQKKDLIILKNKQEYIDFEPSFRWLTESVACMLAFGFGTGLSKIMPGTVGTLVAFIPAFFIAGMGLPQSYLLTLSLVLFLIGIFVCDVVQRKLGCADYSGIVIDEIVAMMLILSIVPVSWQNWLLAFIFFRIFDIWKPWPIRSIDKSISGGLGVMLDDILAVFYVILVFVVFQLFN
ncbi:MAG: phosphatidylglycerophosphatase A [Neisseriaceae bacterium]|nr:MAG: phosphatidylglycerophosphatase A [Neisseriaceae bacterium]